MNFLSKSSQKQLILAVLSLLLGILAFIFNKVVVIRHTPNNTVVAPKVVTSKDKIEPKYFKARKNQYELDIKEFQNPAEFSGLFDNYGKWSAQQKLNVASEMLYISDLPANVIDLYVREVRNKSYDPVLRNNMAEALIKQHTAIRGLPQLFWEMYNDESESPVWRDYSLQFYARCIDFTDNPQEISSNLSRISFNTDSKLGATAAVMQSYNLLEGKAKISDEYKSKLYAVLRTPQETHVTATAQLIAGRIKNQQSYKAICSNLNSKNVFIKRTAIAAISRIAPEIGDKESVRLLNKYIADSDETVAMAAKAAVVRLQKCFEDNK